MDRDATQKKNRYSLLTSDQIFTEIGKLPPQALDMEAAVLGALLVDPDALTNVIDALRPEYFYKVENRTIFEAIYELFHEQSPVDMLTTAAKLREQGRIDIAGGAYYLAELTSKVASTANVEFCARVVNQCYIKRELIRLSAELTKNAYDETIDVLDMLDHAERELLSVGEKSFGSDYVEMGTLIREAIKEVQEASSHEDGISSSAVPSGFRALDKITNGWQKSTLIILAARPAMGKTAFALSMARNMAVEQKKGIAFFSLEMSAVELVTRLISSETELSSQKLKTGDLKDYEWQQLTTRTHELASAPIFIDDSAQLTMFELRAKCRRLKQKYDIKMVFLDYLQLMQGSPEAKGNREQEISKISRQLKGLAKELKIPILALSQLSRAVEGRTNSKKPQLSDLRESGAIEQDADVVMFIYRPEYYNIPSDEFGDTTNRADILIEKHRSGPTGVARLKFIKHFAKFENGDTSQGDPFTTADPMRPNNNFSTGSYVTVDSKMNDASAFDGPSEGDASNVF